MKFGTPGILGTGGMAYPFPGKCSWCFRWRHVEVLREVHLDTGLSFRRMDSADACTLLTRSVSRCHQHGRHLSE